MAFGFPVGGWCPKGRRTEAGPLLDRYPLKETPTSDYAQRTSWNVRDSDGTLLLLRTQPKGGTAWTIREAQRMGKPWLIVDLTKDAQEAVIPWLLAHRIHTLNIAGPRESEDPGIYEVAYSFVTGLLRGFRQAVAG